MTLLFSDKQEKALRSIWVLGIIVAFLQISNYFVNGYGPDNTFYTYLWYSSNWFLQSLLFAWYFYRNKLIAKGLILQLLFMPYYIFQADWSLFIDYHFPIDNSPNIYSVIRFITFFIPLICFAFFYYTSEGRPEGVSRLKGLIVPFLSVLVFSYGVSSDPNTLYSYIGRIGTESLYVKDMIVSIIFLLITFKSIGALIAFMYLSKRIYAIKKLLSPIEVQPISNQFFKWGFMISYTIFLLSIVDMGASIFSISFSSSSSKPTTITYILSYLMILLISGRFFAILLQYRNYTLQKYLGVLNAISIIPFFNLISLFTLLLVKKSVLPMDNYIQGLKRNRYIHLTIYSVLLTLYILYKYYENPAEFRETAMLYKIPVFIIAVILLSRYKISTKIVPFIIVLFFYYQDIKDFFDFTKGPLFFFKEKMFSLLWLGSIALFMFSYVVHYILHKSFYTEYFEEKDEESFEQHIKKFN